MTFSGWIIMVLSVSAVTLLLVWCVYKVFSTPDESQHLHGFEADTPDIKTD